MGSIPVHFTWSRDLYQFAAVTFTVNEAKQLLAAAAGSGWPASGQGVGTTLSHFVQAIETTLSWDHIAKRWTGSE